MESAGPAPGEPGEQAISPGPLHLSSTKWKPPQFILVQFFTTNRSKKSSGPCYAVSLFCTKYIVLTGHFMTSSWGLHTKTCAVGGVLVSAAKQGSCFSRFLGGVFNLVLGFARTVIFMPISGTQGGYALLNTEDLVRCWYKFLSIPFFPFHFPNFHSIQ